jgi:hypothetical protein
MAAKKAPAKKMPTPPKTPKAKSGLSSKNPGFTDINVTDGKNMWITKDFSPRLNVSNAKGFVVGQSRRKKKKK